MFINDFELLKFRSILFVENKEDNKREKDTWKDDNDIDDPPTQTSYSWNPYQCGVRVSIIFRISKVKHDINIHTFFKFKVDLVINSLLFWGAKVAIVLNFEIGFCAFFVCKVIHGVFRVIWRDIKCKVCILSIQGVFNLIF